MSTSLKQWFTVLLDADCSPPTYPPKLDASKNIRSIPNASSHIFQGIAIVQTFQAKPYSKISYSYLIYNASIHYWYVTRRGKRDDTKKFLAKSLSKLFDAYFLFKRKLNLLPLFHQRQLMEQLTYFMRSELRKE